MILTEIRLREEWTRERWTRTTTRACSEVSQGQKKKIFFSSLHGDFARILCNAKTFIHSMGWGDATFFATSSSRIKKMRIKVFFNTITCIYVERYIFICGRTLESSRRDCSPLLFVFILLSFHFRAICVSARRESWLTILSLTQQSITLWHNTKTGVKKSWVSREEWTTKKTTWAKKVRSDGYVCFSINWLYTSNDSWYVLFLLKFTYKKLCFCEKRKAKFNTVEKNWLYSELGQDWKKKIS